MAGVGPGWVAGSEPRGEEGSSTMRTCGVGDKGPGRSGRRLSLSALRTPGRHRSSRLAGMGVTKRSLEKLRDRETRRKREDGSRRLGRWGAGS